MDPFHAENPCPRCGQLGAGFRREGSECDRFGALGEHMHRQCGTCGHEWAEEAHGLKVASRPRVDAPVELEPSRWRAFMFHITGQWRVPSSVRDRRTARS